jgi:hypothetical protein
MNACFKLQIANSSATLLTLYPSFVHTLADSGEAVPNALGGLQREYRLEKWLGEDR